MYKKVALCGFMGSGKSTLLKKLSREGLYCLDLDDWILEHHGADHCDLGSFIRHLGWESFRALESESLKTILNTDQDLLLALGGGTLDQPNNRELIENSANLIWLDVDFDLCLERIRGDDNRPLVAQSNELELKELFEKRQEIYQIAEIKLTNDDVEKIYTFDDLLR